MKKALIILAFLVAVFSAQAQTIVTATLTVTNTSGVAVASTITVNGVTRTAANPVTAAATQFLSGSTIGASATNIFNAFALTRPPSADVFQLSTNAIILKSDPASPMVVTLSAGWGTVTFSTNTITPTTVMRGPHSIAGNVEQTNTATAIVDYINDNKSTSTVSASATPMANFASLTGVQAITGAKSFSGANTYSNSSQVIVGGWATNVGLINIPTLSGTLGNLTNGTFTNPVFTNGQNFGNPFRSPGLGTGSEQFGTGAAATGDFSLAIGRISSAQADSTLAVGNGADAVNPADTAIGEGAVALGGNSIAIGVNTQSSGPGSVALGNNAMAAHTNSTAIGAFVTTTTAHQVRLGTGSESVSIPGTLQVDGSISNATFAGSVTLNNTVAFTRKNITTLVNGAPNLISTSTNLFLKLSGPTGAFTVNAMDGGSDGRMLILYNITGQTMTIANNSGALGVAANRILTGTGADVVGAYAATFIYDSAQSLWILISKN